jgi:hypothetical protein
MGHKRPQCPLNRTSEGWKRDDKRLVRKADHAVKLASDAKIEVPRLTCQANGLKVNALVDTGSTANFVSPRIYEKMLTMGVLTRKLQEVKVFKTACPCNILSCSLAPVVRA